MKNELTNQDKQFSYEEVENWGIFKPLNSNDTTTVDLQDKNRLLDEEVRGMKTEYEIQSVMLCEATKKKKKDRKTTLSLRKTKGKWQQDLKKQ